MDDIRAAVASEGYAVAQDPVLGDGAMLIAVANKFSRFLNWQNHVLFIGQDLSRVAAQMGYIQLSMLGCAGYVKVGSCLDEPIHPDDSLEHYWFTPMYFSDVWQMRRIFHPSDTLIDPYKE